MTTITKEQALKQAVFLLGWSKGKPINKVDPDSTFHRAGKWMTKVEPAMSTALRDYGFATGNQWQFKMDREAIQAAQTNTKEDSMTTTAKKTTKPKVTKCAPAKAKGVKTQADVKNPRRAKPKPTIGARKRAKDAENGKATKKATAKKPAKKVAALSDADVVIVAGKPKLVTRQNLVKLIPKAGVKVSVLVKKAVDAEINPQGATTPEFVRKHIEGAFKARKIALK